MGLAVVLALLLTPRGALASVTLPSGHPTVPASEWFDAGGSHYGDPANAEARQAVRQMLTKGFTTKAYSAAETAAGTALEARAATAAPAVVTGLAEAGGVLGPLSVANAVPQITLAATAGYVGWKIGSGIRNLFVKVEKPVLPGPPAYSPVVLRSFDCPLGKVSGYVVGIGFISGGTTGCSNYPAYFGAGTHKEWIYTGAQLTEQASSGYQSLAVRDDRAYLPGHPFSNTCNSPGGYGVEASTIATQLPAGATFVQTYANGVPIGLGQCYGGIFQPSTETVPKAYSVEPYTSQSYDVSTTGSGASTTGPTDAELGAVLTPEAEATTWLGEEFGAPEEGSFVLPEPQTHETYDHYVERLQALGYVGTATKAALSADTSDPHRGPGEVVRTTPTVGTLIGPDDDVTVRVNPDDAPAATTATPGLPSAGGGCTPWVHPAIDLSPLNVPLPDTFPFGVPFWIASALDNWIGDPQTPEWDFHFPFAGDGTNFTVDLHLFDDYMPAIRAVLLAVSIISLGWLFMATALGFGAGRKED